MTDTDLAAVRSRYLGVDKKKRKIRKMNDRKFVFDWDEQDDTYSSEAPAAVGSNRQGAQVMFGRGHIAGMDDGGASSASHPNGGRKTQGEALQLADALERRKAAKSGIDERHWTEKSLDEMKERDWRIFREDFSIAARGAFLLSIPKLYPSYLSCCRWSNPTPSAFMERIYNPHSNPRRYREDWLQRAIADPTASHSYRSTKQRYHRYRRNRFVFQQPSDFRNVN